MRRSAHRLTRCRAAAAAAAAAARCQACCALPGGWAELGWAVLCGAVPCRVAGQHVSVAVTGARSGVDHNRAQQRGAFRLELEVD